MKIPHTLTSPFVTRAVKRTPSATIRNLLAVMCGVFAISAASGQTTYIWSATNGGTDIGIATNWSPNGQPSGASEDTAEWNGTIPGNLNLVYQTGWPSTGFGTSGVNLYVNTNQTGSVTIVAPTAGSPAAGINGITIDPGAGSLILGDATTHLLNLATRPGNVGQVHFFTNNSVNPAVMNSSIAWVAGGGDACVMDFEGTGDWIINHNLRDNNSGAGPITVQWGSHGTMTWSNGGTFLSSDALGPIIVSNGVVILEGAGLCPSFATGVAAFNNSISNYAEVDYDANVPDTISRFIAGTGTIEVSQSTLTLSGQSIYTGNTILAGTGTLILGSPENPETSGPIGESNSIIFSGGALQFSVNNTFDYSSRFSTGSGQHFNFNGGGQSVTFATGLSNSDAALSMTGPGTVTLAGTNAYGGATVVNSGALIFQGPKSGSGNITVADSATLGVTGSGTQITPATLALGASSGASLDFFNVTSTSTPVIAASAISSGGTLTIDINSGSFAVGQSYPLFSWTSGSAPAVNLGALSGFVGTLSTNNNNSIVLNITGTGYTWTGANNGDWDTTTTGNWLQNGVSSVFANGTPALFNDAATGTTAVVLDGVVDPKSVTVNNTATNYSITSGAGGNIAGTTGLTKQGTNILSMGGGANSYTGVTAILQGTLSVSNLANAGSPSDIGAAASANGNLLLNGGALQYVGAQASVNRPFTVGTGGGTIDSSGTGGLTLSGSIAYSGTGQRVFTLTGIDTDSNILASSLSDNTGAGGTTSLTKNGPGTWIITATNTYSGGTAIEGGTLQVGVGGFSGSLGTGTVQDDASLMFALSSTATFPTITGAGSLTQNGPGELILPGNNTYAAGTTINGGTSEIGTGGVTGSVDAIAAITDNGALIFNSSNPLGSTISGIISGTGTLEKKGSGLLKFIGNNTYTGNTIIDSNATLQLTQGNTGACASTNIIDNGTLLMERQDNGVFIVTGNVSGSGSVVENVSNGNAGDSTLDGSNTYTGGTYILGGGLVLGDDATPGSGSIVGNVYMTNNVAAATFGPFVPASITFDRIDNFTFPGNIVGQGSLTQEGSGTLTVTTLFTYTNGTTITGGTLQIGNGAQAGTIVGTITDNSVFVLDFPGDAAFTNYITGVGSVVQIGSGTLTLVNPTNDYSGATTVSNGTMIITNLVGDMDVSGGTLTTGPAGTITTFNTQSSINISAGNVVVGLNTSLAQSNTIYSSSAVNYTGGTLKLVNFGPALVAGEKFTIFTLPVTGPAPTILSPGFIVTNNLTNDGSISIASVAAPGTEKITATFSGGQVHLSWPAAFTGLDLQVQTNASGKGLSENWVTIPGVSGGNSYAAPINTNYGSVFYRLAP